MEFIGPLSTSLKHLEDAHNKLRTDYKITEDKRILPENEAFYTDFNHLETAIKETAVKIEDFMRTPNLFSNDNQVKEVYSAYSKLENAWELLKQASMKVDSPVIVPFSLISMEENIWEQNKAALEGKIKTIKERLNCLKDATKIQAGPLHQKIEALHQAFHEIRSTSENIRKHGVQKAAENIHALYQDIDCLLSKEAADTEELRIACEVLYEAQKELQELKQEKHFYTFQKSGNVFQLLKKGLKRLTGHSPIEVPLERAPSDIHAIYERMKHKIHVNPHDKSSTNN